MYVSIFFRQENKSIQYKKEEYDLLSYFGDLGGLQALLFIFGQAITSSFVSRLFYAALVKRAYHVQKYMLDRTPYYETSKGTGHLTTESDSDSPKNSIRHSTSVNGERPEELLNLS